MNKSDKPQLSIVVPVYNEQAGLEVFHRLLLNTVKQSFKSYEIIYCDDGSNDNSLTILQSFHHSNPQVKIIRLSRNFGKEYALTAGIANASGDAILTIDSDGQHPVDLIPAFVEAWQSGAQVVIGVRDNQSDNTVFKKYSSILFYNLFNSVTHQKLRVGETDFRLIDKSVQKVFLQLQESNRITRGLIDWLGFDKAYVHFNAKPRKHGVPTYNKKKLLELAENSVVSLTPKPLYFFGYIGVLITSLSLILGIIVFIEQLILNDPLHWNFTGTAMLGILIVFLVGLLLMSQAILSIYVSHIQKQSRQRPLYIIDYHKSVGITDNENT